MSLSHPPSASSEFLYTILDTQHKEKKHVNAGPQVSAQAPVRPVLFLLAVPLALWLCSVDVGICSREERSGVTAAPQAAAQATVRPFPSRDPRSPGSHKRRHSSCCTAAGNHVSRRGEFRCSGAPCPTRWWQPHHQQRCSTVTTFASRLAPTIKSPALTAEKDVQGLAVHQLSSLQLQL